MCISRAPSSSTLPPPRRWAATQVLKHAIFSPFSALGVERLAEARIVRGSLGSDPEHGQPLGNTRRCCSTVGVSLLMLACSCRLACCCASSAAQHGQPTHAAQKVSQARAAAPSGQVRPPDGQRRDAGLRPNRRPRPQHLTRPYHPGPDPHFDRYHAMQALNVAYEKAVPRKREKAAGAAGARPGARPGPRRR